MHPNACPFGRQNLLVSGSRLAAKLWDSIRSVCNIKAQEEPVASSARSFGLGGCQTPISECAHAIRSSVKSLNDFTRSKTLLPSSAREYTVCIGTCGLSRIYVRVSVCAFASNGDSTEAPSDAACSWPRRERLGATIHFQSVEIFRSTSLLQHKTLSRRGNLCAGTIFDPPCEI